MPPDPDGVGRLRVVWRAGLLDAPVGGGPPARSPHASLRLGVIDLEARPGPAAAHGHRSLAPPSPTGAAAWPCHRPRAPLPGPGLLYVAQWWLSIINFACNSPVACSNIEFASLELQRFQGLLKFGPIELHAKFVWLWSCDRPPAPWRVPAARGPPVPSGPSAPSGPFRPPDPPVPSALVGPGVLSWLAATLPRVRYKILPVRAKHAKLGHLGRAGRALYRTCGEKG